MKNNTFILIWRGVHHFERERFFTIDSELFKLRAVDTAYVTVLMYHSYLCNNTTVTTKPGNEVITMFQ